MNRNLPPTNTSSTKWVNSFLIFAFCGLFGIASVVIQLDTAQKEEEAKAKAAKTEAAAKLAEQISLEKRVAEERENFELKKSCAMFELVAREVQGDNVLEVFAYDGPLTETLVHDLCTLRSRETKKEGAFFFELVVFKFAANYTKSKTPIPASFASPAQEYLRHFMRVYFSARVRDQAMGDASWCETTLSDENTKRLTITFTDH